MRKRSADFRLRPSCWPFRRLPTQVPTTPSPRPQLRLGRPHLTAVANQVSKFVAPCKVEPSQVFDNGTNVGIGNTAPAAKLDVSGTGIFRGLLSLPATGTATATAGKNSQPLNFTASAFKTGTGR